MASIAEIRQQYPQYNDLKDNQIADALHRKFYADMPRAEFDAKIGLQQQAEPSTRERARQEAMAEGTMMDAVPRALSHGMLGNLPDYPPAVAAGIGGAISGEGFGGAYERSLEEQRGHREGLSEKYPWTNIAGNIAGSIGPGMAAAKLISAPTTLGRMLQSSLIGGTLGGAHGAASGEGFDDRRQSAREGALWGAGLGAVGEGLVSGASAVAGRMFGGAKVPASGVQPSQRIADAAEFNIPLSRGQATGNVSQQAWEQAALNDARGPIAGRVMRQFDDRQQQAISAARDDIAAGLGPRPATTGEAGDAIAQGLKGRADELHRGATEAYKRAAGKDAHIAAEEVSKLGQSVTRSLEDAGINLDVYGNYPGSQSAMNLLRRVAGFDGAPGGDGKVVAQSLAGLEQARKGLLKVKPGNGEDARALKAIRNAYDDWISDAIDNRLFAGDATALDDLKQARSLWSEYKGMTTAGKTDASKLLAKISTEERTGEEVASWLLSATNSGQAGRAARVASDVARILGRGSDEFEALRQAAWVKIVNPTRGQGSQAISSSILSFVNGPGAPLARTLFKSQEIAQMRRFAGVLRSTLPDPRAANRGQSGYEILRSVTGPGQLMAAGGGIAATWQTGDPKYLALAALPLLRGASMASKSAAAIRPEPSKAGQAVARTARSAIGAGALYGAPFSAIGLPSGK